MRKQARKNGVKKTRKHAGKNGGKQTLTILVTNKARKQIASMFYTNNTSNKATNVESYLQEKSKEPSKHRAIMLKNKERRREASRIKASTQVLKHSSELTHC